MSVTLDQFVIDEALPVVMPTLNTDITNRIRVSNPVKVFQLKGWEYYDTTRYLAEKITGSGAITQDISNGGIKLSTTTANGDKAILQSRRRIHFSLANSTIAVMNVRLSAGQSGLVRRFGWFDGDNGFYFEYDGTTLYTVIKSSITGGGGTTKIAQSSWNMDTVDGNGASGATLLKDNYQVIYGFDFCCVGVRFFVRINGQTIYVHQHNISSVTQYALMTEMCHPMRFEAENTSSISTASSFFISVATMITERDATEVVPIREVSTGVTPVAIDATPKIVAGIRLKSSFVNSSVNPLQFGLQAQTGNDNAFYQVLYNPTMTGATWSDLAGQCQGLTNNPSFSGGSPIQSGFINLSNKGSHSNIEVTIGSADIFLGSDIDDNADALVLVVTTVSGTGSILFSGMYREYI